MEILHLEDDGPLREIMHIALAAADPNMRMVQFTDSDEAVAYIEENHENITLFVLDVRVPGALDGLGVAEKIRACGSDKPILVTSAYRKPDQDRMEAYDCQWMAKPWHLLDAPQTILGLATGAIQRLSSAQPMPKRSEAMRPKARTLTRAVETPSKIIEDEPLPIVNDNGTVSDAGVDELQTILEMDAQNMQPIELDDPIPFDDEDELAIPPSFEQTDLMVAITRQQEEAATTIHNSDDAPTVEPYVEDNEGG